MQSSCQGYWETTPIRLRLHVFKQTDLDSKLSVWRSSLSHFYKNTGLYLKTVPLTKVASLSVAPNFGQCAHGALLNETFLDPHMALLFPCHETYSSTHWWSFIVFPAPKFRVWGRFRSHQYTAGNVAGWNCNMCRYRSFAAYTSKISRDRWPFKFHLVCQWWRGFDTPVLLPSVGSVSLLPPAVRLHTLRPVCSCFTQILFLPFFFSFSIAKLCLHVT